MAERSRSDGQEETIMTSVDRSGTTPRVVIADVSRDGRWISVPEDAARDVLTSR